MRFELAIGAILRDEGRYLREWVAFHRLVGIEHFFLYDNRSVDDPAKVLAAEVDAGVVSLIPWDRTYVGGGQKAAYADCLDRARGVARWVALIDIDEFVFSPTGRALPDVLSAYGDHPGVVVHWQVYGSSGHREDDGGLVTERFTQRAPHAWVRNRRVKSIVDPERTIGGGPHVFTHAGGARAVNERYEPITVVPCSRRQRCVRRHLARLNPRFPVDPYAGQDLFPSNPRVELLRINHYVVKSRAEFEGKMARFSAKARKYNDGYFRYHDRNEVTDPILAQRAHQLRSSLGMVGA